MKKSILIKQGDRIYLFIIDEINDRQIFHLVGCIEKTLHQSFSKHMTDEELRTLAKKELGIDLEPTKLIAEININKQTLGF